MIEELSKPKAALYTLGCRLNQAETAIIANSLKEKGFTIVDSAEIADLTVINTCTVTEQADSKCRQAVRQSIRKNPNTFVAVIGCYAQMSVEAILAIKGVDLIIGNEHKLNLTEYLGDMKKNGQAKIIHTPKISRDSFTIKYTGLYEKQTRANLKIQDGCNFVCSFCIIASARGPARSRVFKDILHEAQKFADNGHKEIVITGVNLGTYQYEDKKFIDVLCSLEKISGIERIRISSIEPTTVDKDLIDFMADSKKMCRYLHIPVQSGDNDILESMRRKHTAKDFINTIDYAYKKIPGIGIGTDVMVGYPGETDQQFINTKKMVVDLPIAYFHIFSYSDRKGTTAYNLKPKIDPQTKKARTRIMIDVGKRQKYAYYQSFLDKEVKVLFEEKVNGFWEGFTDNYMRIQAPAAEDLHNQIRMVRLDQVNEDKILGAIL
ncbi:MAG: tRNA (N(6)-L-threonylcarbamoyladenosine(37)-C(2))-methylthiotransferase MtaB [Calditrichaceae bacterium]|nr:tRNA (N(6)-L-threonylcarbamoyladenosine(37)-C(2))-methylthiotransferase MtaB [Calditrichaceae bacterium]MBN2709603.1 tRNA (N(6)-L-threonylcarbamoyladenosine(37)-C(2))-methylthiotransferase MtaB [Calditrichaceae bacterium]RQV92400.1 MAG: tRNA (N(6)-L-threonylcarbamoyladenosine(37)-C(2))-methylthiotransferase MtaB [Calditrichota bacterium]